MTTRGRSESARRLTRVRDSERNQSPADLGGYLVAKAAAAFSRGLDRDYDDLAYVLLFNNRGGPEAAAREVAQCLDSLGDLGSVVDAVYRPRVESALSAFIDGSRDAAVIYAQEMSRTGSTDDLATLVEDATSAALIFREELSRRVG